MINPSIIQRTNRRTLSLTINQTGDLIVKAPSKMSLDEIFAYINAKQKWIETRQEKIKSILTKNYELINYEKILFLGKIYSVYFAKGTLEKPYLTNDFILLKNTKKLNNIVCQLKQFYLENCDDILIERVVKIAKKLNIKYNEIKIISSKVKWGMCDSKCNLYFNFKLLMLSPKLIDYVIIHELCHIKQLNHSKDFWKLVNNAMPEYKQAQKELKESSFLIKLY